MRRGQKKSRWRAMRHSLFVCGLSLVIAVTGAMAGTFLHADNLPSFMTAVASTPTHSGSTSPRIASSDPAGETAEATPESEKPESTSLGALTKLVKKTTSEKAPPTASTEAAASPTAQATATAPAFEVTSIGTTGASEPLASALPNATPTLAEVAAEAAPLTVSSGRFLSSASTNASRATPTPAPTAVPTAPPRAPVAPLPALVPGDQITVPVTFYYCEDTTGGTRRGDGGGFCGLMRNGQQVRDGAAACDYRILGQRFIIIGDPTGRTYQCDDTGGGIADEHRDIWFWGNADGWAWQAVVGRNAVIQILP